MIINACTLYTVHNLNRNAQISEMQTNAHKQIHCTPLHNHK